jgi:hypothetical protein
MNHTRNKKQRQRGFSLGNMLFVLAIAGSFYVAKGKFSSINLVGAQSAEVIQELGQPVAKESIPRPS